MHLYGTISTSYSDRITVMKTLGSQLDPRLVARSRKSEQLTLLLRQHLPPECDGHYAVASIVRHQLIIVADSPVWGNRLRQLAPQILQLVQSLPENIQHIQVKSRMTAAPPPPAPSTHTGVKRQLSQQAGEQIISAASCIADEPLKSALLKLSRHARKKD